MKVKQDTYDVGVIVGRFQEDELHEAHRGLIEHVLANHERVIIFLGLAPVMVTRENPLDFEARKQMLLEAFPTTTVLFIRDEGSDEVWSAKLDSQLASLLTPSQSVVLYGGRDSFVGHYTGRFPTRELEPEVWVSGTEIRKKISKSVKGTPAFRQGVIWAAYNRFPAAYPTVDVAILSQDGRKLLLGRKPDAILWRFIGGFAEPDSPSYEDDARREVREETHLEIEDPVYLGSFKIDDWRYRHEDKIKTLFFMAKVKSGDPQPDDDIAQLRWFDREEITPQLVTASHRPLLARLAKQQIQTPLEIIR